jgi:hypothetical protein
VARDLDLDLVRVVKEVYPLKSSQSPLPQNLPARAARDLELDLARVVKEVLQSLIHLNGEASLRHRVS